MVGYTGYSPRKILAYHLNRQTNKLIDGSNNGVINIKGYLGCCLYELYEMDL